MLLGRSFLPTSVAGFIQAKTRKLECRGIGSAEPLSGRSTETVLESSNALKLSSVSGLAKLISSKRILDNAPQWHWSRRRSKSKNTLLTTTLLAELWLKGLPTKRKL